MKKLMICVLSVLAVAGLKAGDPASMAAAAVASGAMEEPLASVTFKVDVTEIDQKLDQFQKANLGDNTIATISQKALQSTYVKEAMEQKAREGEDPATIAAEFGVSVTEVKQTLNQDQDIETGEGVMLTIDQEAGQEAHRIGQQ